MAERVRPALGLSIGATNLAAVTANVAIVRKPVLTLYRQRPPEVGVPSENPRLDEAGLVITDFVDRVGDPVGIVAADGSVHRSEALVADGVRALAYAATGGRPLPDGVAVTHPAHWPAKSVDAVGAALGRVSEWSNRARPPLLISDAAAALAAVRANPGIPARGTVAACDFGGSGTSITLMDAARDERVAPTLRHHDFSGDMIDQALLTAVMDNMPAMASFDPGGASAVRSLSRLRTRCRSSKEQLSSSTATTVSDDLPDIWVTRKELDDAIRGSLNNFMAVLDETLRRNGIRDLVAVVSVGGGANIPAVITMLSGHLRVPVVTTPRPQLTAAIGGALRAGRGRDGYNRVALNRAAPATATTPAALAQPQTAATATAEAPVTALAWPKRRNNSRVMHSQVMPVVDTTAGPAVTPEESLAEPEAASVTPRPRRRLIWAAVAGAVVAVLLVGAALAIAVGSGNDKPATTSPGVSTTPASPTHGGGTQPAQSASPTAPQQPPPPSSSDTTPPATTETPTTVVPPASPEGPAPPAAAPARAAPAIPPIPRFPPLPPIPGINEPIPPIPGINEPIPPIPGLAGISGLISQIVPRGR